MAKKFEKIKNEENPYTFQSPSGKILYSDLLFKDRMAVGGLYLASGQKTKTLIPNVHFYFDDELLINRLLKLEIILENNGNLKKQFPYKFNLLPSKGRTVHSEVFRPSFSCKDYPEETSETWKHIIIFELEDFYKYNMLNIAKRFFNKKNISFKEIMSKDRREQYEKLIYSYSPAEICYLIYRAMMKVEEFLRTWEEYDLIWNVPCLFYIEFEEMIQTCTTKKVLPNNIILDQTFFSKYFFNVFLQIGEGYFQIPVPTSEELK